MPPRASAPSPSATPTVSAPSTPTPAVRGSIPLLAEGPARNTLIVTSLDAAARHLSCAVETLDDADEHVSPEERPTFERLSLALLLLMHKAQALRTAAVQQIGLPPDTTPIAPEQVDARMHPAERLSFLASRSHVQKAMFALRAVAVQTAPEQTRAGYAATAAGALAATLQERLLDEYSSLQITTVAAPSAADLLAAAALATARRAPGERSGTPRPRRGRAAGL